MTSSLIFRASSLLNSPLLPLLLSITIHYNHCYHVLNAPIISSLPSRVFCILSCIHFSTYSDNTGSCSRHRYNKTTAVTMPVLVSCVAWALPPTLTITITRPLQQDCKHTQQTLSVVISAELLLAGRRTDNTITFMSSL